MHEKSSPLAAEAQARLRALIAASGVDAAAKRLEIPQGTVLRAAAGCALYACSRAALRVALERLS